MKMYTKLYVPFTVAEFNALQELATREGRTLRNLVHDTICSVLLGEKGIESRVAELERRVAALEIPKEEGADHA
jgi:hypothetical protein